MCFKVVKRHGYSDDRWIRARGHHGLVGPFLLSNPGPTGSRLPCMVSSVGHERLFAS